MSQTNRGPDWWMVCLGGFLALGIALPAAVIVTAALWGAAAWVARWAWWGLVG